MSVIRQSGRSLVGVVLLIAVAACGAAPTNGASVASANPVPTIAAPTLQPSAAVVWGRVPYCNCFATSATANVANALKEANLTIKLKELSPRDGWLYFAVTFDPQAATRDQVGDAMKVGGAEVLTGPP